MTTTPVISADQVTRLVRAYSDATVKLHERNEQLTAACDDLNRRLMQEQAAAERSRRLAALGEMAAGLAHEIRNPLGGISLYAGMLATDLEDQPESQAIARKITAGVRILERLVGDVLDFARPMTAQKRPFDLTDLLTQIADAVGVPIVLDAPPSLEIMADRTLLERLVSNLLLNAQQAAPSAPPPRVEADRIPGGPAVLIIRDYGPGIASDLLDRIFDPFVTTKASGTGLGLAISHRVVEAHDGVMVAANHPEGGAMFRITLPQDEDNVELEARLEALNRGV